MRDTEAGNARYLAVALLAAFAVGAPWLWGGGIDSPDDALYFEVSAWEWLHFAWHNGRDAFFQPGKLAGINLFADAVPMAPFYPAAALLLILPAWLALPVASVAHNLGMLLAVRWLARVFGARPTTATLTGAAMAVGPVGTLGFPDARISGWAALVWISVAVGAIERVRQAPERQLRWRWALVGAVAFGLAILGAHIRLAAATGALLALWVLISGAPIGYGLVVLLGGVLAGSPVLLPTLLEWRQSSPADGAWAERIGGITLGYAPELGLTRIPGWLNPRPWFQFADYSVGAVLGAALILTVGRGRLKLPARRADPRAGRLAAFALLGLTVHYTQAIPIVRLLWTPLFLLTNPINEVYGSLSLGPAAAAAAVGFDELLRLDRSAIVARLRGRRGAVIAGLLLLSLTVPLHSDTVDPEGGVGLHLLSLAQALTVLGAMGWLVLRSDAPVQRRRSLLLALALVDLSLMALRGHLSVPSMALPLRERLAPVAAPELSDGYLDVEDLERLSTFAYVPGGEAFTDGDRSFGTSPLAWLLGRGGEDDGDDEEDWEGLTVGVQESLIEREVPPNGPGGLGLRGLSGVAKMPPLRQVQMLQPLAEAVKDALTEDDEGVREDRIAELFAGQDSLGSRTMGLHGIPVAAGLGLDRHRVRALAPRCYNATATELVPAVDERVRILLSRPFSPAAPVLVESAEAAALPTQPGARVTCAEVGPIDVQATTPALVVLRERWHPGWTLRLDGGDELPTFPFNQVQLAVPVPAGEHRIEARFRPPGLAEALPVAALCWSLLLGGLAGIGLDRRRRG